jgi:hypothetical protein
MDLGQLISMKMGWAKIVALGADYLDLIPQLVASNITPIVRLWRPRFGAGAPEPDMIDAWRRYIAAGARWFEYYNEPNFDNEWPEGHLPDYRDIPGTIQPLMDNWLAWAELMIQMGAYPAFPALAEATGQHMDVARWLDTMMNYLAENHLERFRSVADNGLWVATHPYIYNHFYQESAGALDPRPPGSQRAHEPGWRFEYPLDPITQASFPGLTAVSGPSEYPMGDPIGLTGMGQAFMLKFETLFGGGAIPVIGTEGGISPVPAGMADFHQVDERFPGYDWYSHGEATVAMFNWIAIAGPPWMFGLALWKEDDYVRGGLDPIPAVKRLAETPALPKVVPPLDALGAPGGWLAAGGGPGPIHGAPDHHFVVFAPGFDANWFFAHGRDYWEKFRPALLDSTDFVSRFPRRRSLGLTLLATPEMGEYTARQIRERWPNVWVDVVLAGDAETLAQVLADRTASGRRFG